MHLKLLDCRGCIRYSPCAVLVLSLTGEIQTGTGREEVTAPSSLVLHISKELYSSGHFLKLVFYVCIEETISVLMAKQVVLPFRCLMWGFMCWKMLLLYLKVPGML